MEGNPPKIFRVKDPDPIPLKHPPIHPNLPQIDGFGGGAMILMISPISTGKCLFEYSLVQTEQGNKYIKDVNIKDKVLSDNGYVEVKDVIKQGKKKCYKIVLENNNELILTENHKIHTKNGMKEMKDCNNEEIITKNGISKINTKEYYGEVECYDISVNSEEHRFFCNNISVSNSTIISNLLLSEDFYNAQERFDDTFIISNTIANCITSRYVRQAFTTFDEYHDSIIDGIIAKQKRCESKEDMNDIAIIVDDCLGSIPINSSVNSLAAKFRHWNVRLLLFSSQRFHGAVSPVIRANATNVIIGSPFPNSKELGHIAESYGDNYGGEKKFLEIYKIATPNSYDFLHLDLKSNPPRAYHNFETLIAEGDKILVNTTVDSDESDEESGGANFIYSDDEE